MVDEEFKQRIDALERDGLGDSLSTGQIIGFIATCFVLPVLIAVIGRGLV